MRIRTLSENPDSAMKEIRACIGIQERIGWYPEIVPAREFRADTIRLADASINLGYVLIAVDDTPEEETVLGYLRVSFSGSPDRHWLHEIAVDPNVRSRGTGRALMQAARRTSLELGGRAVYFTFDPFEGQNGRLYLNRCGSRGYRVLENFYGTMERPDGTALSTHRLLTRWDLVSELQPDWAAKQPDGFPTAAECSSSENPEHVLIELPFSLEELEATAVQHWHQNVLPLLIEWIDHRGYEAVYVHTDWEERRNYLVLEQVEVVDR